MSKKGNLFARFSTVAFILAFLGVLLYAQMTPIYRFRNAQIPLTLKVDDKELAKGTYDVEFLRTSSPVLYYIKFMKRGKILGIVQGEEWRYSSGIAGDTIHDDSIPVSPKLKMTINRDEKVLTFVFESGRNALNYPLVRARFKFSYVD